MTKRGGLRVDPHPERDLSIEVLNAVNIVNEKKKAVREGNRIPAHAANHQHEISEVKVVA